MLISRKKKSTRKYEPLNEFRINHSLSSMHHPDYVFGKKNGKFKSFGLTHTPKEEYKSVELTGNPSPKDKKKSHLQVKVKTTSEKYMSSPLKKWKFNDFDMGIVRHYKKKYKKSQNKKRR